MNGERNLDTRLPATRNEVPTDPADEECMALIEEPVQLTAPPSDNLDEVCVESCEDPDEGRDGQAVDLTTLEA
jgi:hypothetical protein